jgi:DNA-binding IscR family transcriptional regulator
MSIEEKILDMTKDKNGVHINTIHKAHKIPKVYIKRILSNLMEKGKVVKVNTRKGHFYFYKREEY